MNVDANKDSLSYLARFLVRILVATALAVSGMFSVFYLAGYLADVLSIDIPGGPTLVAACALAIFVFNRVAGKELREQFRSNRHDKSA